MRSHRRPYRENEPRASGERMADSPEPLLDPRSTMRWYAFVRPQATLVFRDEDVGPDAL